MCKKQVKSEKRETIAKKLVIKQKKGATLAGQMSHLKTVKTYRGKTITSKS